ncbi:MAG: PorT family protein [Chitinophagaceae bacterium]|nr:PorT family protein [Chitinophagaceae bacterium]
MKKKVLALFIVGLAISSVSLAQGFHLGIKGGANLLKIDDRAFKDEFKFGYNLGGFAEINFNNKWGIQPEVLWSQSTYRTTTDINEVVPDSKSDFDVKLNYLQIPLVLTYRPIKLISLQAGPQFGILLNEDRTLLQNGGDAFKKGDFSMLGGVQLNLGPLKAGARYVVGLADIKDLPEQGEWKSQGWQLYLGVRIF